jgi:RHS repeat-associated protein
VTDNEDYTYGPDGLRLRAQESNNPNPDRWFQYDGVRPVLEGTLADDTFTTVNRYVWEGDTYYSPLIHADFADQTRYFLYDGLGSTRQLLNSNQDVTDTYVYEAFGNPISDGGPTPNPYRYVGSLGYYQTGSSLMHLGARYYMPEIERFTVGDPLYVYRRYTYAGNGPVNIVDPAGLLTADDIWHEFVGDPEKLARCVQDADNARSDRRWGCARAYADCLANAWCNTMGQPNSGRLQEIAFGIAAAGCSAAYAGCLAWAEARHVGAVNWCQQLYGPFNPAGGPSTPDLPGPPPIRLWW